jgi:hypothetical protein
MNPGRRLRVLAAAFRLKTQLSVPAGACQPDGTCSSFPLPSGSNTLVRADRCPPTRRHLRLPAAPPTRMFRTGFDGDIETWEEHQRCPHRRSTPTSRS